jgi:hypothetical protein
MEAFCAPRLFLLVVTTLTLLAAGVSNAADEKIWGTIVDENGDTYLVESNDGTHYKVEWYAGNSTWNVGDTVILTTESGMGFMVNGTDHTYAWIEETDQSSLDDDEDPD